MRGARHDQAVALLTGHSGKEIYLVVQRDHNYINTSNSPPTVLLPYRLYINILISV